MLFIRKVIYENQKLMILKILMLRRKDPNTDPRGTPEFIF